MTPRRPTIDDLCEKYRDETAHTGQVTSLALLLFDMSRDWLGLVESDRPILEAASRLHDIGYMLDPPHHPVAGAHIITREGVKDFSDKDTALIAGIVLLHSGPVKDLVESPIIRTLRDRPRALRLGALLRVADGLDHGHLQDASIESVQRKDHFIEVMVRSELWPGNLVAAERKADLWRATFPFGIRILPTPAMAGETPPLITPEHQPVSAAQRLLFYQYRMLTGHAAGVIAGNDIEHLHEFRVALRRSRNLLRHFRKHLPPESSERVFRLLTRLQRAVGPARDMDVWLEILERAGEAPSLRRDPEWKVFLQRQRSARQAMQPLVERCLQGAVWRELRTRMGLLLRIELPRAGGASPDRQALRALVTKKWNKALRRVEKARPLADSEKPRDLHKLRIALRRARHFSEFFTTVLGPTALVRGERLRAAERELGRIHDLDVGSLRIKPARVRAPSALKKFLAKRREKHLKRFRRAWKGVARMASAS